MSGFVMIKVINYPYGRWYFYTFISQKKDEWEMKIPAGAYLCEMAIFLMIKVIKYD
jgi:hypothetical protein